MTNKVKCPKCGHMNNPGADHCSNCGYKLKQTKQASSVSFLQSIYKTAMACPRAAGDVELNTKNRDKTIEKHNYGPLNLSDDGYWELIADKWNTTESVARKSKCGNCVAFDVSPRMDECMPGPVSDGEGRLGYCWMHHFKCHSARTCNTWAKGGPIKKDEASHDWQKKAKGMEKEANVLDPVYDVLPSHLDTRSGFIDPRSDDFAKNQAVGRAMGVGGLLFGVPATVAGTAYRTGKGDGALKAIAKGNLMGLGTAALPAAITYKLSLDKFRERQKRGLNPATNQPYNLKRIERLTAGAKKRAKRLSPKARERFEARMRKEAASPSFKENLKTEINPFNPKSTFHQGGMTVAGGAAGAGLGKLIGGNKGAFYGAGIGAGLGLLKGTYNKFKQDFGKNKNQIPMQKNAEDSSVKSDILKAFKAEGGALGMKALKKHVKAGNLQAKLKELMDEGKIYKHRDGDLIKKATATATKTDPAKWEAAKREAKAKMGGKHSARAMQLATQIYKKKGGGYSGSKPTSKNNSLKKWTKQKWGYSGKDKPGQGGSGVYLPEAKRKRLKATKQGRKQLAAATRKKHKATAQGQQYSSHGLAKGTSLKKTASSSRVKSRTAYYDPQQSMSQPLPLGLMNRGNAEQLNKHSIQVAKSNEQKTMMKNMMAPPAPPPSLQNNTPMVEPPFKPKYSGM